MSTETLQQKIRESAPFRSDEAFRPEGLYVARKYAPSTISEAADLMIRAGELDRLPDGKVRRAKPSASIAHGPWRRLSNAEIGIEEAVA